MQVLHESALTDILARWYAGMPKAQIAREVAVDRKTVRKYVRAAEAAGLRAGGPPLTAEEWAALARDRFPHVVDTRRRQSTWAEVDRYRERIAALAGTTSVAGIHRRLREEHGLAVSLASFRRYLRTQPPRPERHA